MSLRQASHRQVTIGLAGVNPKVKHGESKATGRKQYVEVIEPRKVKMGLDDVVTFNGNQNRKLRYASDFLHPGVVEHGMLTKVE